MIAVWYLGTVLLIKQLSFHFSRRLRKSFRSMEASSRAGEERHLQSSGEWDKMPTGTPLTGPEERDGLACSDCAGNWYRYQGVYGFHLQLQSTAAVPSPRTAPTFHHGHWILHFGPQNVWSKYCSQVLDTHLVNAGMSLNFIKEPWKNPPEKSKEEGIHKSLLRLKALSFVLFSNNPNTCNDLRNYCSLDIQCNPRSLPEKTGCFLPEVPT